MTDYVDKVHDDDHTYLLNLPMLDCGVMAMAFNNFWMASPQCTKADIDLAIDAFRDSCQQLTDQI